MATTITDASAYPYSYSFDQSKDYDRFTMSSLGSLVSFEIAGNVNFYPSDISLESTGNLSNDQVMFYAHTNPRQGSFDIATYISFHENLNSTNGGGIAIRNSLTATSASNVSGYFLLYFTGASAICYSASGNGDPRVILNTVPVSGSSIWLRLKKDNNQVRFYWSNNYNTWTFVASSSNCNFNTAPYVGLLFSNTTFTGAMPVLTFGDATLSERFYALSNYGNPIGSTNTPNIRITNGLVWLIRRDTRISFT